MNEWNFRKLSIDCYCGCGVLRIVDYNTKEDRDGGYGIIYYAESFYSKQDGIFRTLWNRIRFAFNILRGKEFFLYDIMMNEKQYQELKDFVNQPIKEPIVWKPVK
jgi:hypothetical protein